MMLGFSLRLENGFRIPSHGPALIVANHQSFLDPILVGIATQRHLSYLARDTLFRNPAFGLFLRVLNAVPIQREGVGKDGIQAILKRLEAGAAVVVFPEGERTHDGAMHPLRAGISLLIKRVKAPIVPVGIAGSYHAWSRWHKVPMLAPLFLPDCKATLAVSVGKPLDGRRFTDLPREQVLHELFVEMQKVQKRAERLRRE